MDAYEHTKVKRTTALVLIGLLVVFLFIALSRFLSALFGALIITTLFMPMYTWLIKKGIKPSTSAIIICLTSTIIIAIPIVFLSSVIVTEATNIINNREIISQQLSIFAQNQPQLQQIVSQTITSVASSTQQLAINTLNRLASFALNSIIMYFLLYFMLVERKRTIQGLRKYIPFKKKNTDKLIEEFKRITHTTIIGAGLVAIIQGAILAAGFAIVGIKSPVLLGLIAALISFLPVLGVPLIWIPIVIMQFIQGNIWTGIGALITGLIVTITDYVIRPRYQQKKGNIHPLISIIGVFIGIQYFGFFGIVVGPLLLSYMVLTINMFFEEYVQSE